MIVKMKNYVKKMAKTQLFYTPQKVRKQKPPIPPPIIITDFSAISYLAFVPKLRSFSIGHELSGMSNLRQESLHMKKIKRSDLNFRLEAVNSAQKIGVAKTAELFNLTRDTVYRQLCCFLSYGNNFYHLKKKYRNIF